MFTTWDDTNLPTLDKYIAGRQMRISIAGRQMHGNNGDWHGSFTWRPRERSNEPSYFCVWPDVLILNASISLFNSNPVILEWQCAICILKRIKMWLRALLEDMHSLFDCVYALFQCKKKIALLHIQMRYAKRQGNANTEVRCLHDNDSQTRSEPAARSSQAYMHIVVICPSDTIVYTKRWERKTCLANPATQ